MSTAKQLAQEIRTLSRRLDDLYAECHERSEQWVKDPTVPFEATEYQDEIMSLYIQIEVKADSLADIVISTGLNP